MLFQIGEFCLRLFYEDAVMLRIWKFESQQGARQSTIPMAGVPHSAQRYIINLDWANKDAAITLIPFEDTN